MTETETPRVNPPRGYDYYARRVFEVAQENPDADPYDPVSMMVFTEEIAETLCIRENPLKNEVEKLLPDSQAAFLLRQRP